MSWIEKQENCRCWIACWRQGGREVRRSTGIRIEASASGLTRADWLRETFERVTGAEKEPDARQRARLQKQTKNKQKRL